ncbi:MAG: 3-deoxy-8-phosphooctulonate synthase [Holosporales bacterium]|jgi:2-dehydro-3-deoxyphosphooctonate aldolase (KDO 8-P synthase)|nr:3-deoxy-8-phosphooctulonate synthase [Holosporales bacterium]
MQSVTVGGFEVANDKPFVFIGGPCVIESLDHSLRMCCEIKSVCERLGVDYIFKSSFDKANRTSISGKRGIGLDEGLRILSDVKSEFEVPVITDVHLPDQCSAVAEVVDVIQIPAFLCRQTDLLAAAAKTGRVVNVKKGQFVAPMDMASVAEKLRHFGATEIMLCDRGTCFGYNTLVTDFRGIPIMAQTGCPIIFDATHSVQMPSANGTSSGGERKFAPILARAAAAVGVAGIFMEVHDDPDKAPCDGPNMIRMDNLEQILTELVAIDTVSKKFKRTI